MSIFNKFLEIEHQHGIKLHEGENFKQALYNDKLTDSEECIIDKILLIIKHYPDNKDLSLSVYQSDETSDKDFCYVVVLP